MLAAKRARRNPGARVCSRRSHRGSRAARSRRRSKSQRARKHHKGSRLGIVTRSSADWIQTSEGSWSKARVPQTRGLSRQHNRFLKYLFKGAATTVVTQRNKDPIHARYERLLDGGTKPTLAKLSLARRIAATVLRIWKDEEEYDPERASLSPKTREGQAMARSGESVRQQRSEHAAAKRVRTPRMAWPRRRASLFFLADGPPPGGPTRKRCPSEEPNEAMADRGPDGRMVPTVSWRAHTPTNRGAMELPSNRILRPSGS